MPRVLLVAYEFPPKGGSGVLRALKLVKYLPRLGWDVSVLTVADPPTAYLDHALERQVPAGVSVVKAWSLEPTRLVQLRERLRSSPSGTAAGLGAGSYSGASPRVVSAVRALFVPDEKRLWQWWAVRAAAAEARVRPPHIVVSTGPPQTAHLVGSAIARRLRVPHVVDLRDPWVGNHFFAPPTPMHAALGSRLERTVFSRAAAVVTTADSVTADVSVRYGGLQVETIYNGFDPDDLAGVDEVSIDRVAISPGFSFVHAGTFSGARTPRWFLAGLARAERESPGLAREVSSVFVGVGREVESMAAEEGVSGRVMGTGYLSHRETLATLARASVALLIVSAGEESRISIPGKVFEYFGMRKPVLALAGDGDLAAILDRVSGVTRVLPEDPTVIAQGIMGTVAEWRRGGLVGPRAEEAAEFSRVRVAERYDRVLREALERASR